MSAVDLARLQFATTTIYHFLFVPLRIGLALLTALLQTRWHRTGEPEYLRARPCVSSRRSRAGTSIRSAPDAALSERELTVLRLLPSLLSLGEIAADLTVSVDTVRSHVRSIYAKLGVSSRRLVVLAAGLLTSSVHRSGP